MLWHKKPEISPEFTTTLWLFATNLGAISLGRTPQQLPWRRLTGSGSVVTRWEGVTDADDADAPERMPP
jgi:hypothetical protein